jgi:hypothetical protein
MIERGWIAMEVLPGTAVGILAVIVTPGALPTAVSITDEAGA